MKMKCVSLAVLTAALIATAGCTNVGYNGSYGGPGYGDQSRPGAAQYPGDRSDRWNRRYNRTYSYNDDGYYQQCRNSPDPAGVIIGGLIGGLIGNAAGHGRAGSTIAGVIIGGALGAALTSNLDCEDRSYAYRSYYDGLNSGRAGNRQQWRNPRNDHRGDFRVDGYYDDPDGFRCANFTQDTYIQGRQQESRGRACRQPDGSWVTVN
jgi:surface antigen